MDRWASFDCYGTLIDWDGGARQALGRIFPGHEDAAFARYHAVEPMLQADGTRTYRQVLTDAVPAIAGAEGWEVPDGGGDAFAGSLSSWPPFPEVASSLAELRTRGWRLAILSNTDADYLDASLTRIGVPVDIRIVASAIGSYKPAFGHWEAFFRESGADRSRHVHVAASLFHDVQPCAALGLPCVWIDRRGETSPLPRAAQRPDLTQLADVLEELVPA